MRQFLRYLMVKLMAYNVEKIVTKWLVGKFELEKLLALLKSRNVRRDGVVKVSTSQNARINVQFIKAVRSYSIPLP